MLLQIWMLLCGRKISQMKYRWPVVCMQSRQQFLFVLCFSSFKTKVGDYTQEKKKKKKKIRRYINCYCNDHLKPELLTVKQSLRLGFVQQCSSLNAKLDASTETLLLEINRRSFPKVCLLITGVTKLLNYLDKTLAAILFEHNSSCLSLK